MNSKMSCPGSTQMINAVLAAHKIAIWEYDVIAGKALFSENYFDILGLREAGIVYETIEQYCRFVHPEDRINFNLQVFNDRIRNPREFISGCARMLGANGEIIWLEENFLTSSGEDENGNPLKLIFYTENVTERREREETIKYMERRSRRIIEAMPEFIFVFDDNFFIRDVLKSENITLLHPVEELIDLDGRKVYSPEVSDLFLHNIRECLSDGQIKEIEYPLDMKGQGRFYFQARIAPFEENRVLALIHDVGDRVQRSAELLEAKRKAEESDKMKSLFLANMSHEIRTPLNAIIGFSDIITTTEDAEEREEYAKIVHQNSALLLQLINDVLDLSRIESGKSEMIIQPTELSALMSEIEQVQRLKMRPGVEFRTIYPDRKIWTHTDRNRVMQVLFNFLSNAVKNTERGSITLELTEESSSLRFSVSDTGCGIPEDKLPQIFYRFEKLDEFKAGTGLGLAICQSIAEGLGGRIEVESQVDSGSKFTLILPYRFVKSEQRSAYGKWHVVVPESNDASCGSEKS